MMDLDLAKTMGATNPVYYCQYSHARLATILESGSSYELDLTGDLLVHDSERNLLKIMNEFTNVVLDAGLTREPYQILLQRKTLQHPYQLLLSTLSLIQHYQFSCSSYILDHL